MLETGIRLRNRARASSLIEVVTTGSFLAYGFLVTKDDVVLGPECVAPGARVMDTKVGFAHVSHPSRGSCSTIPRHTLGNKNVPAQ